jgi:quercetin dioxygenase-like cupin family protein
VSETPAPALCTFWSDIPDEFVRPGVRRRAFGSDRCLVVLNECSPGMEPNPHSHDFEQLAMITAGQGIFHVDDQAHRVGPGAVMLIPAGAVHYLEPLGDEVVTNVDIFAPAREDYRYMLSWMSNAAALGAAEDSTPR